MLKIKLFFISLLFCSAAFGQSGSFGDTFIFEGGEFTIYEVHDFQGNGSVNGGILGSERAGLKGFMSFAPNSSYINSSDKAHLDGYVRTYHANSFIFPIGHKGKWRPAGVSGSSDVSPLDAAYYSINPSEADLPGTGLFNRELRESQIRLVTDLEYWDINGSFETKITLSWEFGSSIEDLTLGQLGSLRIVGWDGSKWVMIPSSVDNLSILDVTSDLERGSITSSDLLAPDSFEVYTLASIIIDSDGDGVTDGDEVRDNTNLLDPCEFVLSSQTVSTSQAWKDSDCDGDGLTNQNEIDPDGDGISGPEGTDPLNADTDGDGNPDNTDPNTTVAKANDDLVSAVSGRPSVFEILENDDFLIGSDLELTNTLLGTAQGIVSFDAETGTMSYTPSAEELEGAEVTVVYQVCHAGVCANAVVRIKILAEESNITPINFSVLGYNDKNRNCIKDTGEDETDLPDSELYIKVYDLDDNLLYTNGISSGQFEVVDFNGNLNQIYYFILDTNEDEADLNPNMPDGWSTGMESPKLKRYFYFDGIVKTNTSPVVDLLDSSWKSTFPLTICFIRNEFEAITDSFEDLPVNINENFIIGNVLTNDLMNGTSVQSSDVLISIRDEGGLLEISIDEEGNLKVPKDAGQGSYVVIYSICDRSNPTNCSEAMVLIEIRETVNLKITKISQMQNVYEGDELDYIIRIENNSAGRATNVQVKDLLPLGLRYISSAASVGTPVVAIKGQEITWTFSSISGGESVELTLKVKVAPLFDGNEKTILNQATVQSDQIDLNLVDNTSTALIKVLPFFIPNVITPNGDGLNDTFEIKGLSKFLRNELLIFNRFGDHIFKKIEYKNDWAAKGLVDGTYFYLLNVTEENGKNLDYQGWIQVITKD